MVTTNYPAEHTCPSCGNTEKCEKNSWCTTGCHDSNCRVWNCDDANCRHYNCVDCLEAAFIERLEQAGIVHNMQGGNPRRIDDNRY